MMKNLTVTKVCDGWDEYNLKYDNHDIDGTVEVRDVTCLFYVFLNDDWIIVKLRDEKTKQWHEAEFYNHDRDHESDYSKAPKWAKWIYENAC